MNKKRERKREKMRREERGREIEEYMKEEQRNKRLFNGSTAADWLMGC